MRPSPPRLVLAAALALIALAPVSFVAAELPSPAPQTDFYPRPAFFQITGSCSGEVSPDQAVIVGGVSSSGLKPEDAVEQLDKELALMRSYVAQNHGELQMMERVRTLKNPNPQSNRPDTEPPFEVLQRLQATFPPDAPVDAILQKLIELGLDRFGDNVLNNNNRREAVIRFHISHLDDKLKELQQRCTSDAWKQWCANPQMGANCPSPTPPSDLDLQSFTLHSKELLMRPEGNSMTWQINISRFQRGPDPPDLLGNVTVHLEGNIMLGYHPPDAKP